MRKLSFWLLLLVIAVLARADPKPLKTPLSLFAQTKVRKFKIKAEKKEVAVIFHDSLEISRLFSKQKWKYIYRKV